MPKHLKQPLSLAEIQDYRPQLHPITNGSGGLQIKIPTTQQRSPRGALLSPGGLVISPGAVVPGLSISPGTVPGGLSISPGSNIRISPVAQLHHVHPPPSYQAKKILNLKRRNSFDFMFLSFKNDLFEI